MGKIIRFKVGRGILVTHKQYGDGRVTEVFSINKIRWYTVRISENLIIQTPASEWELRKAE